MSIDHIISGIRNSRIGEVIWIGDSTTLLDYRHQFMESLYVVDSSVGNIHISPFPVSRSHKVHANYPRLL